jgi:hypothetical protein
MARRIRGGFVEHKAACRMCAPFVGQWIKDDTEQRTNWFDKITGVLLRAWLQWSEPLSACLFLSFPSGDPRLPDIAGIQTRFSRRGQIDYGFDARGLCVCLGPVCFEKYRLGHAVTNRFFLHMLWENTSTPLHNSLIRYTRTCTRSEGTMFEVQKHDSGIWKQLLSVAISLTFFPIILGDFYGLVLQLRGKSLKKRSDVFTVIFPVS